MKVVTSVWSALSRAEDSFAGGFAVRTAEIMAKAFNEPVRRPTRAGTECCFRGEYAGTDLFRALPDRDRAPENSCRRRRVADNRASAHAAFLAPGQYRRDRSSCG